MDYMNTDAEWTPIIASHECSSAACFECHQERSDTFVTETEFVTGLLREHGLMMARVTADDFALVVISDVEYNARVHCA